MNRNLKDKVTKLENNVLQKPVRGSTKICTCAFPEPEQVLLEKARQLALMNIPYEETTPTQKLIQEKAGLLLNFRVFDLFISYLEGWSFGDYHAKITINERFLWFIQQLRKEIRQNLDVAEIEKNMPVDSEVDLVDQYFRKAPELFTKESWYKLQDDLTQEWVKHMKESGKWKAFLEKWGPQKKMAKEVILTDLSQKGEIK